MGLRFRVAQLVGAVSEQVLHRLFHRPAANFPGKAGLLIDSDLIGDLRDRLREGSIVVVGTNGKTTVTNLLADSLEAAGKTVACNRTGANLDSGVATALLKARTADWGVFESDELWLAKVAPQLRPRYVVLLNLFRDQLDRMGEIDHIQESIASALASSPDTVLVYNGDDPLCQAIAGVVDNNRIAFGVGEELGLSGNSVVDADICPWCGSALDYRWRQYGQLGSYQCPDCGFGRPNPAYTASDVELGTEGVSLVVRGDSFQVAVASELAGAYSVYNVLATCVAADCCGVPPEPLCRAIGSFSPDNGRLQHYRLDGGEVLLNLAKNPMGFNQNLRIVEGEPGSKAVAFFINDKEADGHDVSWLWDVDFQELAGADGLRAYAGGIRRNDMQVRLKYAGIHAELVDDAEDFVTRARAVLPDAKLFLIANYTALPAVKTQLDTLAQAAGSSAQGKAEAAGLGPRGKVPAVGSGPHGKVPATEPGPHGKTRTPDAVEFPLKLESKSAGAGSSARLSFTHPPEDPARQVQGECLSVVHLYPKLLNLYGDGGNVTVLAERARRRGIDVEVACTDLDELARLADADIVFLGGGPDREQRLAAEGLSKLADELRAYVEGDGVLLAICGGYQMLGKSWILDGESVEGLGLVDIETRRAEGGSHNRLVGNIALESPLARMPVIGYENHAGRTYLGSDCQPFGRIMGHCGRGNNGKDGMDGVLYRNVVGTYLHGPLLAKNPEVADALIARALARRAENGGRPAQALPSLDDAMERAANKFMCTKLGIRC